MSDTIRTEKICLAHYTPYCAANLHQVAKMISDALPEGCAVTFVNQRNMDSSSPDYNPDLMTAYFNVTIGE